jgi:hypothetical protein
MRFVVAIATIACAVAALLAQTRGQTATPDPVRTLVNRLELDRYKATIKGLTQFGDRREGTQRNRDAVDWIEAQLKSYGCTNTERLRYTTPVAFPRSAAQSGPVRGVRLPTPVNNNPNAQPDERLRALNAQPALPGPLEEVYCTKIGARPNEMYIVGAHMDGIGWGEAANDNGSGTAIVMELARIFSSPDVSTERSIRFILWNSEESGLHGSRAYVEQRQALQGIENPPGSGRYPEPKWLGMVQHDMMMFDHGMPRADRTINPNQRPEADVNIEFQTGSKFAAEAQTLALQFLAANAAYAANYPASVGMFMSNTDSASFQDFVPAISLRENERGSQIGAGWDPHWHQPTDLYATFSDDDFRLGLNAAQITLGAIGRLAGAAVR